MDLKIQAVKEMKFKQFIPSLGIKIILVLILIILILPEVYYFTYQGKIYPGVEVIGLHVGNKTPTEADKIITEALANNSSNTITFEYNNQKWNINLDEISFQYDINKTVETAFQLGRQNQFIKNITDQINLWKNHQNLQLDYHLDQNQLDDQIASIASQIAVPIFEPSIKLTTDKGKTIVEIEQGKDGQELDQSKTINTFNDHLAQANFQTISLPVVIKSSVLDENRSSILKAKAESLLGKKVTVKFEDNKWELTEKDLTSFLNLNGQFDQEKIKVWLSNTANSVNRLPQNAAFKFENGKVLEFKPAKDGIELNIDQSIDNLMDAMNKTFTENSVEMTLSVQSTPPQISTDKVNNLGIKEKIGSGLSLFKGSIASRIHNINLASNRLNGTLVGPEEIFSFNKTVGDISEATGYEQAYIIQNGRTVLGDGGGVCQVSTTLFRAALNSGLEIVERHAHAYRVGYYEQGFPPGLDATVYSPNTDFKFKNNTDNWILIQTNVDTKQQKLTFDLYGTSDNRQVTISTPKVSDQTPPPPDLYQDDPTLPIGQTKQIDWKAWGAKVIFDYKVVRNGEVLQSKSFYSAYQPWQAIFLKGTKTD